MLFNSFDFAVFLPIVFIIYWSLSKNIKIQNIFLLLASYIFYGWWDWRFLSLIIFSTFIDYLIGILLLKENNNQKRRFFLFISIIVNIAFLGFFKYFNFFIETFIKTFLIFGMSFKAYHLNIILPVGISFYTFQTMSYSIDVYKRKLEPTKDFIAFATFVSFFPQLVAGPIERAGNLLPQFFIKRSFNYEKAVNGMRQILWGLFKKMVIADNCAVYVNHVFENYHNQTGSTLLFGAIFFAFQIYCDFSGYSDIAIGVSKLFGFNLIRNFAYPYFSRDIAEFWRRWHISLNTWFRDYIYIPLGGNRCAKLITIRNTLIIFLVSGFWHGANWTFIAWGLFHAILFLPLLLLNKNRKFIDTVAKDRIFPDLKEFFQIFLTFGIIVVSWVFFRAETISDAFGYLKQMLDSSIFLLPTNKRLLLKNIIFILFMLIFEWFGREKQFALDNIFSNNIEIGGGGG
jgi:D-alanyl-lipoteichoic acid acyltransferase DltB (MBOAT superfamily)